MPLNEPYATWFEAVVGQPAPEEQGATCADCPMCAARGFDPQVKCCTYMPSLPNFQAGRALLVGGEAGDRVRARMAQGRPTATWLHPSEAEDALYDAHRHAFGATRDVLCPYASGQGTCTIWPYRNAVCATWFCRHDDGPTGAAMWDAAVELFHFAEGGAAVWCAGDGYEAAAARGATLTWDEIRRLGGAELAVREEALRAAHAAWSVTRAAAVDHAEQAPAAILRPGEPGEGVEP